MTRAPDNSGNSSRLDRIEAILEHSVSDQAKLRESLLQLTQRVDDMASDRAELRESLLQLIQRVDDMASDRAELRESLLQLTQRVGKIVDRMTQFEEKTELEISELVRGRAIMTEALRTITETQLSLKAGQERQERLLDYLMRKDKPDANS